MLGGPTEPPAEWDRTIPRQSPAYVIRETGLQAMLGNYNAWSDHHYLYRDDRSPVLFPARFDETAEYLVFVRKLWEMPGDKWVAIAAFRVEYRPNRAGDVVGYLTGDASLDDEYRALAVDKGLWPEPERPGASEFDPLPLPASTAQAMTLPKAREAIRTRLSGRGGVNGAAQAMDDFLHRASVSAARRKPEPPSFADRFRRARRLAAATRMGTTRADVEKMFPVRDGGITGSEGRYYYGSDVKIVVPFTFSRSGNGSQDGVDGPVRVYREPMNWF